MPSFLSKLTANGSAQWEELLEPTPTYTGQFTRETASITRVFRVPQASLNSFFSEAYPIEYPRAGRHPTFQFLFVSNIDFGQMPGSNLTDNSGVAEHDYWQLSVTYTPLESQDEDEQATPDTTQPQDFLTGNVSFTTETMTLPGYGLKWLSTGAEITEPEVQPFMVIPVSQWSITIPRARSIPWQAMRVCRGKVNKDFFWGAYPETLLYTGMNVSYRHSNDGSRQYDIEHHFSEKLIVWNADEDGAETEFLGWNAYYNSTTKSFDDIVTDDYKRLYSRTSFFPQLLNI